MPGKLLIKMTAIRQALEKDRGPLPPRIDPLFGLLIGALAVLVLIAMLTLLSLRS
jgi:hypothetical protein